MLNNKKKFMNAIGYEKEKSTLFSEKDKELIADAIRKKGITPTNDIDGALKELGYVEGNGVDVFMNELKKSESNEENKEASKGKREGSNPSHSPINPLIPINPIDSNNGKNGKNGKNGTMGEDMEKHKYLFEGKGHCFVFVLDKNGDFIVY